MKTVFASLVLIVLAACAGTQARADSGPRHITEERKLGDVAGGEFDLFSLKVDGMPCLVVRGYVYAGESPAITCDWSRR